MSGYRPMEAALPAEAKKAASPLLAALHGEIFEEGWNALAFEAMLATPGTAAIPSSTAPAPDRQTKTHRTFRIFAGKESVFADPDFVRLDLADRRTGTGSVRLGIQIPGNVFDIVILLEDAHMPVDKRCRPRSEIARFVPAGGRSHIVVVVGA